MIEGCAAGIARLRGVEAGGIGEIFVRLATVVECRVESLPTTLVARDRQRCPLDREPTYRNTARPL